MYNQSCSTNRFVVWYLSEIQDVYSGPRVKTYTCLLLWKYNCNWSTTVDVNFIFNHTADVVQKLKMTVAVDVI